MNTTDNTPHKDPLIDAYHQASVREGARAGANLRAAVLAHARVVAQSLPSSAANAGALRDTTRGKPAANEASPIWRLAAGVVVGLVGVWIFQLTRPADAPDAPVATVATVAPPSQPQAGKAQVAESTSVTQPAGTAAAPETTVAVAAPARAAPSAAVDASGSRTRADVANSRKPPESPRAENAVAAVRAPLRAERADLRAPVPFGVDTNASRSGGTGIATAAAATAADTNTGETFSEVVVASAELRKSAKVAASPFSDQPAMAGAAPRLSPAAPDAFPAKTATQAAPNAAEAARPRSLPLDERDQAMFRALRVGDLSALRAAIARGANVNARDERGRTTLQIARERDDGAVVDTLKAAGAR